MSVELPPALESVLGLLGLNWPQANEDAVVELADQLGKLASAIDSVQMSADKALTRLGEVYHGSSADKLAEVWGAISKYSGLVVTACGTMANALHAAALVIEACKGQTLIQLTTIQAELAAASATGPWSTEAVIQMGREIVSRLLDEAAAKLGKTLAEPVSDLVDTAVKKVTGPGSQQSGGHGFGVDPAQLAACALELRREADDIDSHGSSFRRILDGLKVGTPGDMFGKLVIDAAEHIAESVGVQVLNRVLGSFRDTADKMDLVVRNLTENEDSHAQQMNGVMASVNFGLAGPGRLQLAGGAPTLPVSGGGRDAGLAAFGALLPKLDGLGGGGAAGIAGLGGALNVLGGVHGGAPNRPAGPSAANHSGGEAGPEGSRSQYPGLPISLGRVSATRRSDQGQSRTDLETGGGQERTEASGVGGRPAPPLAGMLHPVPHGQAADGGHQSRRAGGLIQASMAAQQRDDRGRRRNVPFGEPVEDLADRPDADLDLDGGSPR